MSANIVLTGLMGGGKSTVGKLLAKELTGYIFVDIDDVIVDLEGMTIPEIFEKKGEAYFREVEKNIIAEFSEEENLVIALGGGAFENEENRETLLNSGIVFYLRAGVDTLYERIKGDTNRPLLQCDNPKGKLEELLKKREPNYLKAHHAIDTDKMSLDKIIETIINKCA
ncbi:MAG: shikimate kinase [Cyanobacteria bacterium RUI128]|nr:shikimate kinase [Cyanobacteria bacterium RUI128]